MSEISRDKIEVNSIKPNKIDFKGKQAEKCPPCPAETENICSDYLKNQPGEVLGRSQVSAKKINKISLNNELAQNIKKDLEFLGNNPELINKADKMYELAYLKATKDKNPDPYKTATETQMGYIQEMNKE